MPSSPQKVFLPPYALERTCRSLSEEEKIDAQLELLSVPETWLLTRGEGVRVAIIDTVGMSFHPDLSGAIDEKLSQDFSGDGLEDQGTFHGVFCSGLVGARQDARGIVGVAPKATLILLRALGNDGSGSVVAVKEALRKCVEIRPDIVSMSLGMQEPDEEIENLVRQLYSLNIPCVCASGNDGMLGTVNFPASMPETIAVGAVDEKGNIASFSSRGEQVDICAPGVKIYSLYGKSGYCRMSGTSMACPIVAGIVALLIAKHRKQEAETGLNDCKTVEEIRIHLKKHATPKGDPNAYGAGLVNPMASLKDGEVDAKGFPWSPTKWVLENDYVTTGADVKGGLGMTINWDSPDGCLTVRNNIWTVKAGFGWDGCSGVPDFLDAIDPITQKPKTYYPSLCHDVGYRCLRLFPESFPYSKREIDRLFLRLGRQYRFRLAWLYYLGVRLFGGWAIRPEKSKVV